MRRLTIWPHLHELVRRLPARSHPLPSRPLRHLAHVLDLCDSRPLGGRIAYGVRFDCAFFVFLVIQMDGATIQVITLPVGCLLIGLELTSSFGVIRDLPIARIYVGCVYHGWIVCDSMNKMVVFEQTACENGKDYKCVYICGWQIKGKFAARHGGIQTINTKNGVRNGGGGQRGSGYNSHPAWVYSKLWARVIYIHIRASATNAPRQRIYTHGVAPIRTPIPPNSIVSHVL